MSLSRSYRVLGIKGNEDIKMIKRIYKKFAHKYHPDKTRDDSKSLQMFIDAKQAYELIIKQMHNKKKSSQHSVKIKK